MNRLPGKCPVLVCLSLSRSAWGSCNADLSINKILSNILFLHPLLANGNKCCQSKKLLKNLFFLLFKIFGVYGAQRGYIFQISTLWGGYKGSGR